MLRAILNKSWQQHPTRHQLYGHLPPITKTIQVRRTRHAGHCWRSRDELIRDVLLWIPTHGRAKAGRPARTYIQQLCEDTGCCPEDLPRAMNDREEWRERVRDIRAASTIWWWWWWKVAWILVGNPLKLLLIKSEAVKKLIIFSVRVLYSYWCNKLIRRSNKRRRKTSLTKYLPLTLLQGFERVVWGFTVRGSWRPNINCNILTPLLWPSRCVFLVLLMLNRRPRGSLCCVMAFFIASYQHLLRTSAHQGPRPLRPGVAFPITSSLHWNSNSLAGTQLPTAPATANCSTSVLTALYNSSTPIWSPTRSLKSNV